MNELRYDALEYHAAPFLADEVHLVDDDERELVQLLLVDERGDEALRAFDRRDADHAAGRQRHGAARRVVRLDQHAEVAGEAQQLRVHLVDHGAIRQYQQHFCVAQQTGANQEQYRHQRFARRRRQVVPDNKNEFEGKIQTSERRLSYTILPPLVTKSSSKQSVCH